MARETDPELVEEVFEVESDTVLTPGGGPYKTVLEPEYGDPGVEGGPFGARPPGQHLDSERNEPPDAPGDIA